MTTARQILLLQILAHISLVPMILYATPEQWAVSLFIYFLTGCLGFSMTFHRLLSHSSWNAPTWFKYLGILLGSLALAGSALAWSAIHREHHNFTDTPKDPHSPHHKKWWQVQFFSMYPKPNLRLVKDLLKDPFIVFSHRHYLLIQIVYCAILASAVEPFAVIYAYLFPAAILWQLGSAINTLGHIWGYRNYPSSDGSKNNLLLGYLFWGEGWHNNHHARPRSKIFSRRWWEFDLSGLIIRKIERAQRTIQ